MNESKNGKDYQDSWEPCDMTHEIGPEMLPEEAVRTFDEGFNCAQSILATFGPEGPTRCSGLDVRRYSVDMLADELGPTFRLADSRLEAHTTPAGESQQFLHARFEQVG